MAILTRSPELRNRGGSKCHPDAVGSAGEDQVTRAQRACLGDEVDQLPTAEDQVRGAAVLAQLAVDPGAQSQVTGVGDLVGGGHPRTERTERVSALGARPLRLAPLQVAGGDIVGDAVAADLARRRRSRSPARPRSPDGVTTSGQRIGPPGGATEPRTLTNTIGVSGRVAARLLHVPGVVESDRVDGAGLGHRRQQRAPRPAARSQHRRAAAAPASTSTTARSAGERDHPVAIDAPGQRAVASGRLERRELHAVQAIRRRPPAPAARSCSTA